MMTNSKMFQSHLKMGLLAGARKGIISFVWLCKIVIPISFVVTLLQWTGWLSELYSLLHPLMRLINLPPEAALPIVTGMLLNLYAVIAIITALPFTIGQMTLIAIFNLIAHGLLMEGIVQHKSGLNIIKAFAVRGSIAILTVLVVSQFLGDTSQSVAIPASLAVRTPVLEVLEDWVKDTGILLLKVFGIIMFIMIALESLQSLGWMNYLLRLSRPLMQVLGLSERTTMMWVTANLFGLFYGGAVIAEEAKKGDLTRDELERLHIFIGCNHSMIEDPALFAVLGLNAFWLWVPRFIVAVIAVHTYRITRYLKNRLGRH